MNPRERHFGPPYAYEQGDLDIRWGDTRPANPRFAHGEGPAGMWDLGGAPPREIINKSYHARREAARDDTQPLESWELLEATVATVREIWA